MKLIDNASGNVKQGITLDSTNKADRYKISYICSSIGSGKSFIRIYATLSDSSYRTYFMPIQFNGEISFEFNIDVEAAFLQFDMIGDANLTGITLETVVDATMEYVKENAAYWDRIKEVTSSTGKLRADTLEGLINLTVNAFANEGGTITQINGVQTFLNGTTVENSTQAVQIKGGAIRVANSKLSDGSWNWTTAINGAGINADTIVSGILRAITISGVDITGSSITGGTVTGAKIQGGEIFIGAYELNEDDTVNLSTFTGTHINTGGIIRGYKDGSPTYYLTHTAEGRIAIGTNVEDYSSPTLSIDSISGNNYGGISTRSNNGLQLTTQNGSSIILQDNGGVKILTPNRNGTVYVEGNIDCTGYIRAMGGVS